MKSDTQANFQLLFYYQVKIKHKLLTIELIYMGPLNLHNMMKERKNLICLLTSQKKYMKKMKHKKETLSTTNKTLIT